MKKLALLTTALLFLNFSIKTFSINTSGCMLHVDNAYFNHSKLIKLTWKSDIIEYDYLSNQFRLRIEFNGVGFQGSQGICYVGAMIQNLGHNFSPDILGSQFSNPQTITNFPSLGLYFSSLHTDWLDSKHGVKCLIDNNIYPKFARVFENVDNLGSSAKNIYTRVNLIQSNITYPVSIKWFVNKKGSVTNPSDNLSKNINGSWIPLVGTYIIWNFQVEINGTLYDVADYYLPIEYAEYILASDPLVLHQEHFGGAEMILNSEKTKVRYSEISASDGINWFPLVKWKLTSRLDDGNNNQDNRFGWKTEEGKYLVSVCGHEEDIITAKRDVNSLFEIKPVLSVSTNSLTIEALENRISSFEVLSNTNWIITCSESWVKSNVSTGSGNAKITLTTEANLITIKREATITISAQDAIPQMIKIVQDRVPVGIKRFENDDIEIYPNPTNSILFINGINQTTKVSVINSQGKVMINKRLTNNHIDVSSLSKGIYVIIIETQTGTKRKRFIKK